MTTAPLHSCAGCSHRRPAPPLRGWALARRVGWWALLVWVGLTFLLGLVAWVAVIAVVG